MGNSNGTQHSADEWEVGIGRDHWCKPGDCRVAITGLIDAGKSNFLYRLAGSYVCILWILTSCINNNPQRF